MEALITIGKTLHIKYGNWLCRVPIDRFLPDSNGVEKAEENYVDPIDGKREIC